MPPASASLSSRTLFDFLRPVRRRPCCKCPQSRSHRGSPNATRNSRRMSSTSRPMSTATPLTSEMEVTPESDSGPRWSKTPPAMRAPVRVRKRPESNQPLKVNSDPKKLDDVYIKFLGPGGDRLLSEESKWLAVTHKSFDHGRRGFNDRLSFLGMRIVELQTSLGLLAATDAARYGKEVKKDPYEREHYEHPALDSVETLLGGSRRWFTYHKQLSGLGARFGLPDVVRWVPRKVSHCHVKKTGSELMLCSQTVYKLPVRTWSMPKPFWRLSAHLQWSKEAQSPIRSLKIEYLLL